MFFRTSNGLCEEDSRSLPSSDNRPELTMASELIKNVSLNFLCDVVAEVVTTLLCESCLLTLPIMFGGPHYGVQVNCTACTFNKDHNRIKMKISTFSWYNNVPFMHPRVFHSCMPSTRLRVNLKSLPFIVLSGLLN